MGFALGPVAASAGYRIAGYSTIGSTNAEALARARSGDPGDLWIVARQQTEGRGRRGRAWQTEAGNLAATLLFATAAPAASVATLGFVAGLALEEAIRLCGDSSPGTGEAESAQSAEPGEGNCPTASAIDPHPLAFRELGSPRRGEEETLPPIPGEGWPGLRLKWPNDVLLDGAKVAGILLETVSDGAARRSVAIGIGVNVATAPDDMPYPVTSLADHGGTADAETLFTALSDAWVRQMAAWDEARGFASVRRRWLDRAAGLAAAISVQHGDAVLRGTFETIDQDGRLVLRTSDGLPHLISAGDVHFGAPANLGLPT